ncbi:MAG: hypothetical protein IKM16_01560 [Clostridia bacterium]|nr:hypothetical protein [Clostridia bacterium]MBQ7224129.1 hypothetical protein [Clostridia bacterium]MBR6773331.1 hypothetical protein [Clostridia bacterium]MBR7140613.1 hypothetical protein [Clostridia bacterium]
MEEKKTQPTKPTQAERTKAEKEKFEKLKKEREMAEFKRRYFAYYDDIKISHREDW